MKKIFGFSIIMGAVILALTVSMAQAREFSGLENMMGGNIDHEAMHQNHMQGFAGRGMMNGHGYRMPLNHVNGCEKSIMMN